MSDSRLPPELWDCIVDLLHDQPGTLKQCCLVSKSWTPRTRKHLFAEIAFRYHTDLKAWRDIFPDPANSPAHYIRSLSFDESVQAIFGVVLGRDYWVRVFHNVVELKFRRIFSLSQFYISTLVHYLPNLEDLTARNLSMSVGDDVVVFQVSTSPPFTGTLTISSSRRMDRLVTWLLSLPNGIHFRKFKFSWKVETDVQWMMDLVEACSDTLEHFDLEPRVKEDMFTVSFDFSKATKLSSAVLRVEEDMVPWVTLALKTITPEHRVLREVTIYINFPFTSSLADSPVDARQIIGEKPYTQWMDLDYALVQLCKFGTVRVRVGFSSAGKWKEMRGYAESLLPEITKERNVRLVYCIHSR